MNIIKQMISIALLSLIAFSSIDVNAEVAVIVNPGNSSTFSEKDIKRIFLGKKKKFSNGSSVIAINLASGDAIRASFEKNAVGKSASQMKA